MTAHGRPAQRSFRPLLAALLALSCLLRALSASANLLCEYVSSADQIIAAIGRSSDPALRLCIDTGTPDTPWKWPVLRPGSLPFSALANAEKGGTCAWISSGRNFSFAAASALIVPAGMNLTIECPEGLLVNLHSSQGRPTIKRGAVLALVGCDVITVASRALAAAAPPPLAYLDDYFGRSEGTLRVTGGRMLLPSEFFRMYVGVYTNTLPEIHASGDNRAEFRGSRVHMSPHCNALAVAFEFAQFSSMPAGTAGVQYIFDNSTIWYSSWGQGQVDDIIEEAEVARDGADDLYCVFGSAVNPNDSTIMACSEEPRKFTSRLYPILPSGEPMPQWTATSFSNNSGLGNPDEGLLTREDSGIPCMPRGNGHTQYNLPVGAVVVAEGEPLLLVTEENVAVVSENSRANHADSLAADDEADDDGDNDKALSVPVILLIVAGCAALIGLFAAVALLYNTAMLVRRRPGQQGGGAGSESAAVAPQIPHHLAPHVARSDASDRSRSSHAAVPPSAAPTDAAANATNEIRSDDVPLPHDNLTAMQRSVSGGRNDNFFVTKHDGHAFVQRSAFASSSHSRKGSDQIPEIRSILECETGSMHAVHTTETTSEGPMSQLQLPHPTPPATGATGDGADFAVRTASHSVSTMEPASMSHTGASSAANPMVPSQARSCTQDTARSTAQRAPSSDPSPSHASYMGSSASKLAQPPMQASSSPFHVPTSQPPRMGDVPPRPQSPKPPYDKLAAGPTLSQPHITTAPSGTPLYRPPSEPPSLSRAVSSTAPKNSQKVPGSIEMASTSSMHEPPDLSLEASRSLSARARPNLMRILPLNDEAPPSHIYNTTTQSTVESVGSGSGAVAATSGKAPSQSQGGGTAATSTSTATAAALGPAPPVPPQSRGPLVGGLRPSYPASSTPPGSRPTPPSSPRISIHPPISPPSSRDSRGNAYTPQHHDQLRELVLRPPGPLGGAADASSHAPPWGGPQDASSHNAPQSPLAQPPPQAPPLFAPQSSSGFPLSPTTPLDSVDMHTAHKTPTSTITSEQRAQLRSAVQELLREGSGAARDQNQGRSGYVSNLEELLPNMPSSSSNTHHRRSSSGHMSAQSLYYSQRGGNPASHHPQPPNSASSAPRSANHASSHYDTCTHSVNSSEGTTNTYRVTSSVTSSGGSMRTQSGGLPGTGYIISQRSGHGGHRPASSEGSMGRRLSPPGGGVAGGSGAAAAATQPPLPQPPLPLPPLQPSTLRGVSAAYRANQGLVLARSEGRSTMSIPGLAFTTSPPPTTPNMNSRGGNSGSLSPNPRPNTAPHSHIRSRGARNYNMPYVSQPRSLDFPADRSSGGGTSILLSLPASHDGSVASAAASPSASTRNATALAASGYYNSSPGSGGLGSGVGVAPGGPPASGPHSGRYGGNPRSMGGASSNPPSSWGAYGGGRSALSSGSTGGFFTPGSMGSTQTTPEEFDFRIPQPSSTKRASTGGLPTPPPAGGVDTPVRGGPSETVTVPDLQPRVSIDLQPGESRYPDFRPFSFPTAEPSSGEPSRRDESTQVYEKRRSHGHHRRS